MQFIPMLRCILFIVIIISWSKASLGADCNSNGVDDAAEIAASSSLDCNSNSVPDECDPSGDFTGDGLVTPGADFNLFATCQTLPCSNAPCIPSLYADGCCALADHDADGDVDLADYDATQHVVPPMDCNSNGVPDYVEFMPVFVEHAVGSHPGARQIVAADMDGDGDGDVLALRPRFITYYSNTNGDGEFDSGVTLGGTGFLRRLFDLAIADSDSDGDLDIIFASNQSGLFWIENLDSQETFSPHARHVSSGMASFVIPADVDGDQDVDLISRMLDFGSSVESLGWYENEVGLGIFGAQHVIGPPGASNGVAADINGDDNLDLVTNDVSWFENTNGLGQFGMQQVISTNGVGDVVALDVDNDGDTDIVSISQVGAVRSIVWHENADGGGSFAPALAISAASHTPQRMAIADLDNDGDQDLIATHAGSIGLGWYENSPNAAGFEPVRSIASQTSGLSPLFAVDIEGDGDVDLVSGSSSAEVLVWFENRSPNCNGNAILDICELASLDCNSNDVIDECEVRGGATKDCNTNGIPDLCDLASGTIADCNSNGLDDRCETSNDCNNNSFPDDCDVVAATSTDCNSNGSPDVCDTRIRFGPRAGVSSRYSSFVLDLAAADLDGDGDADVASAEYGSGVSWYKSNGMGGFEERNVTDFLNVADGATAVKLVDIDNDGDVDVISGSVYDNKVAWYPNDGSGQFGAQVLISAVPVGNRTGFDRMFLDVGDVDGDGHLDVVSSSSSDDVVAWYANTNGLGGYSARHIIGTAPDVRGVVLVDMDGDADLDVLSTSEGDGVLAWYENSNGAGGFGATNPIATYEVAAWWVDTADLDGDLDQDILIASPGGLIAWHKNIDGSGVFGPTIPIYAGAAGARTVIAVDLDLDGDLDVMSASQSDHKLQWYENVDGHGAFASPTDPQLHLDVGSVTTADVDGDGDQDVIASTWYNFTNFDPTIAWFENRLGDCNGNGIPDACDVATGTDEDCNGNTVIDACESFRGGDFDDNASVDEVDWLGFSECLAGPMQSLPIGVPCQNMCLAAFDSNGDGDLDLRDLAEFVRQFDVP